MTDLRGRVDLREVELPTSPSAYPSVPTDFSLELGSTQRTVVFCARSATELQEWLCHLRAQIARARAASSPAASAYAASLGFRLALGVGVGLRVRDSPNLNPNPNPNPNSNPSPIPNPHLFAAKFVVWCPSRLVLGLLCVG